MKTLVLGFLTLSVSMTPAFATERRHHRHHPHHRGHIVGTHARHGEAGFPITAAKDSIRINAVGEVISQPVPVIQKERNFDTRARHDLSTPQPQTPLPATPAPAPAHP